MLRLWARARFPWVDSRGRVRSAIEEFDLLSQTAQNFVNSELDSEFVCREYGIIRSDDAPSYVKSLTSSESSGSMPAYPLGAEHAYRFSPAVSPLLAKLVSALLCPSHYHIVIVSEAVWTDDSGWLDFVSGVERGQIHAQRLPFVRLPNTNRYMAPVSENIDTLLKGWWPSGLGSLAVISVVSAEQQVLTEALAQRGMLNLDALPSIRQYITTSRTFDNLGVCVLMHRSGSERAREAAAVAGWIDGRELS